jgi:hypothetical protein
MSFHDAILGKSIVMLSSVKGKYLAFKSFRPYVYFTNAFIFPIHDSVIVKHLGPSYRINRFLFREGFYKFYLLLMKNIGHV